MVVHEKDRLFALIRPLPFHGKAVIKLCQAAAFKDRRKQLRQKRPKHNKFIRVGVIAVRDRFIADHSAQSSRVLFCTNVHVCFLRYAALSQAKSLAEGDDEILDIGHNAFCRKASPVTQLVCSKLRNINTVEINLPDASVRHDAV